MNPYSAVYERPSIIRLCARSDIIAFFHRAVMSFLASIAYVWSTVEAFTNGFSEVGASLKTSLDVLSESSVA
jgi:hypothetical protein